MKKNKKVKIICYKTESAVNGINSINIPILVISGTNDNYYGRESTIYRARNKIKNSQCTFELMTKGSHNGHYDYFLTDAAVKYQARAQIKPTIKKWTKKPMPNMMLIL